MSGLFDDEDRPLPPAVKRDLDRAAAGIGRTPTAAHPDCICGKPTGEFSKYWAYEDGSPAPIYGQARDCPQHRPEKS
jgi:hypothetical protein